MELARLSEQHATERQQLREISAQEKDQQRAELVQSHEKALAELKQKHDKILQLKEEFIEDLKQRVQNIKKLWEKATNLEYTLTRFKLLMLQKQQGSCYEQA